MSRTVLSSGIFVASLGLFSLLPLHAADTDPRSVTARERGPHHTKWETVTRGPHPLTGETVNLTNSYVELGSGLNYVDESGRWAPASEEIEPGNGYATARKGQHKVIWAANINTHGAIDFETPDGERLRSHVLGLAYFDPDTGESVMIGEIQDSIGQVGEKLVLYPDAFKGIKADLKYTYTKGGFAQDVVIREQLPDPALLGFDPDTVQVQVLTEFVELPAEFLFEREAAELEKQDRLPELTQVAVDEQAPYAVDEKLRLGGMVMGKGRAFKTPGRGGRGAVVRKQLEEFEGNRNILVEVLEYNAMETDLRTLPASSRDNASLLRDSGERYAGTGVRRAPQAPARDLAQLVEESGTLMASLDPAVHDANGYVIDYNLSGTTNNLVLASDTTYYISGPVTATGTTTIEGGTVVKYGTATDAHLKITGSVRTMTRNHLPAFFTASTDNTVGTYVASGPPSGHYGQYGLWLEDISSDLTHLNFRFLRKGVYYDSSTADPQYLSHASFVEVDEAVMADADDVYLRNVLFNDVGDALSTSGSGIVGHLEHLTVNGADAFNASSGSLTLNVTNSLLVDITTMGGTYTGNGNSIQASAGGLFQSAAAGYHYLSATSTNRNAGVTNISPQLKLDFRKMTTYPPTVYSNVVFTNTLVLSPVVQRDTDTPDLGYHYPAADYLTAYLQFQGADLILTNGVAVTTSGHLGNRVMFYMDDGGLVSVGTATQPNIISEYMAVGEQPLVWGLSSQSGMAMAVVLDTYSSGDNVSASYDFTHLLGVNPVSIGNAFSSGGSSLNMDSLTIRNSEFWNPQMISFAANIPSFTLQNNLLHRFDRQYLASATSGSGYIRNNTFHHGEIEDKSSGTHQWTITDNYLYKTAFSFTGSSPTNHHNGYVTNFTTLPGGSGNNVVVPDLAQPFRLGPLGDFYLPSDSTLIDAGSRDADDAGLYHFTTQASQAKETNSVVDIGYHYVGQDSVYSAGAGFSSTQGANHWSYLYATNLAVAVTELQLYDINHWSTTDVGWDIYCRIFPEKQYAGYSRDSSRVFEAPHDGLVSIRGLVSDLQTCWGGASYDGVRLRILKNGSPTLDWTIVDESIANVTARSAMQVASGDLIHFQINRRYNNPCDVVYWNPLLVYESGDHQSGAYDADGDGVPDYLEDSNGNGSHDAGSESDWEDYESLNGLSGAGDIEVYTPLE